MLVLSLESLVALNTSLFIL